MHVHTNQHLSDIDQKHESDSTVEISLKCMFGSQREPKSGGSYLFYVHQ